MPMDLLLCLPPELMDMVLGYLIPSHTINIHPTNARVIYLHELDVLSRALRQRSNTLLELGYGHLLPCSALLDLSATSKTIRATVSAFCTRELARWLAPVTKSELPGKGKPKPKKVPQRWKIPAGMTDISPVTELIRHSKMYCVWCQKTTQRRAILFNGMACCARCDKEWWPDKITLTEAKKRYKLKDQHLFHIVLGCAPFWPSIRHGTYSCQGSTATMLFRKDVERLHNAVYKKPFNTKLALDAQIWHLKVLLLYAEQRRLLRWADQLVGVRKSDPRDDRIATALDDHYNRLTDELRKLPDLAQEPLRFNKGEIAYHMIMEAFCQKESNHQVTSCKTEYASEVSKAGAEDYLVNVTAARIRKGEITDFDDLRHSGWANLVAAKQAIIQIKRDLAEE
ncbi:hypothetical protein K461DRAFT_321339 [Myriangium duriaei CBS 260.36]|uniref:Uncharacterized protein n=1 Tax=Myriangium duriaei CBS 260.36 TaxID=1168546 RepID=A0A9P4IYP4_9PEZI|nr:hypothetical protein K461DRAFT_321339 [Myriangium duriaei CBS 260.36]